MSFLISSWKNILHLFQSLSQTINASLSLSLSLTVSKTNQAVLVFLNGPFPASFSLFSSCLFNRVDSKCSLYNFSDEWIRTAGLWNRKRPLYKLSHNRCQQAVLFVKTIKGKTLLHWRSIVTAAPLCPNCGLGAVWPDWAINWTLGKFLKPLATINWPKSLLFLGNFCNGVKI